MKHLTGLIILILSLSNCDSTTQQDQLESVKTPTLTKAEKTIGHTANIAHPKDSLRYEIFLEKKVFPTDGPIAITLMAKNTTNQTLKIWIDAGPYPTGTKLTLLDAS